MQPDGWRWHHFTHEERTIRFGSVFPKGQTPDAVVVCLQGVREFTEKYYELAQWCVDRNLAFWMMDWVGQGGSSRYLSNPQKRHSAGFKADAEDFHSFILEYVHHACVHPDVGRIPMVMLAHSMGSNIGLRVMSRYPDLFACAAFTAPMMQIKATKYIPTFIGTPLTGLLRFIMGNAYVPGGHDWKKGTERARLTSDPQRKLIQDLWYEANPDLRCGDVTMGWLYHAYRSCLHVQKETFLKHITAPCLFGLPGQEDLVDNETVHKCARHIPHAQIIDYPGAYHEILIENDAVRDNFLNHFYSLVKEHVIDKPERLKQF